MCSLELIAGQALTAANAFQVTVRHSISDQRFGLPKALPVNVFINDDLTIPGFEFGARS